MYGKIFKEERERAGMSQDALAESLGFNTGQYISNIERGLCLPSAVHYRTLAKILGKAAARRLVEAELRERATRFRAAALQWDE